ncbi:hypothetical protein A7D27_24595 [Pseudomonas sp. 1D4]|uniref:RING finger protein n=1 Tax=Pseudomonas sp. 1D4 TaxID=1843691 RepID=UPI00084B2529|nr:RING finger protein [Pseudomonas sp. 1D4]OEC37793.1 hypothetical protein A7D27_24595 [Pseudomonas sp. 1D4]
MELFVTIIVVVLAIAFLRGFDRIAGRGPSQISEGLRQYGSPKQGFSLFKLKPKRVPCPACAEMILPQATKCPFCRTDIER